MNRLITAFSLAACIPLSAGPVLAQSENSGAGWSALMVTPIGALTPVGPTAANDTSWYQFRLRYGHWRIEDATDMHTIGLGVALRRGSTRTTLEFGYGHDASCLDCNYTMLGVDLDVPLTRAPASDPGRLRVALNPAAGIGDGAGTALSGALRIPVSIALPAGGMSLTPFISPGVGYGRVFFGLTFSAHRVIIDGAPTVYGVGLSIGE